MLTQRFRQRVEVQERVTVIDSHGQKVEQWQTKIADGVLLDSVPAEVLTGPGFVRWERLDADKMTADVGARITMRWFSGMSVNDRIIFDGKAFGLYKEPITDATGRRWMTCECSAGAFDEGQ